MEKIVILCIEDISEMMEILKSNGLEDDDYFEMSDGEVGDLINGLLLYDNHNHVEEEFFGRGSMVVEVRVKELLKKVINILDKF